MAPNKEPIIAKLTMPFCWRKSMPGRAIPTDHPEIALDASLPLPLYKQLYERLRAAILSGQLERGARLPSTRTLAAELGVSRNTTALAYDMLLMEGFLESRVGQGTVVARSLERPVVHPAEPVLHGEADTADRVDGLREILARERVERTPGGTFRGGHPALDLFPYDVWARLVARRARQADARSAYYQTPAGYAPLREAIAAHIGITRGVRCSPEQIIITAGSQGALDLACRTLLNPGDPAWIENPGYFGAQGALLAAGAQLIPVPVDADGLIVAEGQRRCPDARLVSTTPSHQFPTTVTMSLPRRLALLDWAERSGAWILEDDYDSEYRFSGRPLEALQGLDRAGRVIYIGTFSKTLFPALRIGYLVAPAGLIEPLLAMRRFIDVHPSTLEQMALADFIREGHFARHLRHMLGHYARRRDLLRRELTAKFGDLLDVHAPEAGMHLVAWLPPGWDDRAAMQATSRVGLEVISITQSSLEPLDRGGLLFGFAGTSEEMIVEGVARLESALRSQI
jgi:GntR family transcriptional regulator/MocR family aminotransferase